MRGNFPAHGYTDGEDLETRIAEEEAEKQGALERDPAVDEAVREACTFAWPTPANLAVWRREMIARQALRGLRTRVADAVIQAAGKGSW